MFVLDEKQNGLPRSDVGKMVTLFTSINEPKIAAADRAAEATAAFICEVDVGAGKRHMHIVLYLTKSNVRVMYSWEEGPYLPERYSEVESEALDFVENMGFMMDNLNLSKLPADQRKSLLDSIPICPAAKSEPAIDDLLPLGELLDQPTSVATSIPMKAAPSPKTVTPLDSREIELGDFDENASLAILESEFSRDDTGELDLDGIGDSPPEPVAAKPIAPPAPAFTTNPTTKKKGEENAGIITRFLASF